VNILLDTHLLLWWLADDPSLSLEARSLISDSRNTLFVSAVSWWEIWLKVSLGKLHVPPGFAERASEEGFENLPLTAEQTSHLSSLPWHHRDPFDRMLVAQAQHENLVLLTADEMNSRYGDFVRLTR